jgi:hypothetical protein
MIFSVWSFNLTKLHFDPKNMLKDLEWSLEYNLRFWTEIRMNYGQNSSIVRNL